MVCSTKEFVMVTKSQNLKNINFGDNIRGRINFGFQSHVVNLFTQHSIFYPIIAFLMYLIMRYECYSKVVE